MHPIVWVAGTAAGGNSQRQGVLPRPNPLLGGIVPPVLPAFVPVNLFLFRHGVALPACLFLFGVGVEGRLLRNLNDLPRQGMLPSRRMKRILEARIGSRVLWYCGGLFVVFSYCRVALVCCICVTIPFLLPGR